MAFTETSDKLREFPFTNATSFLALTQRPSDDPLQKDGEKKNWLLSRLLIGFLPSTVDEFTDGLYEW